MACTPLTDVTTVSAGSRFTCSLQGGGRVTWWGNGDSAGEGHVASEIDGRWRPNLDVVNAR